MKTTIALTALALTSATHAGVTTEIYNDGDAGFLALTEDGTLEQAVVESRIGNAQGNGGWELGLWRFGAVGTPLDQDDRVIDNGEMASFTMNYDGATTLSFSIDGAEVSSMEIGGTFTDIFIRMRGGSDSTVAFSDLMIDGNALDVDAVSTTDGVGYLRITNMGADFGAFEMTGIQTLSWTGNRPNNSGLAAQFKLTNVVPAPGAIALLGLGGLVTARRRR